MKIFNEATIGLEKSFPMIYSNIGLNSRETVPLNVFMASLGFNISLLVAFLSEFNFGAFTNFKVSFL